MPIRECDLPPISPDRHFIYCPDPLLLTDQQLDMLFPREVRNELFPTSMASHLQEHSQSKPEIRHANKRPTNADKWTTNDPKNAF